MHKMRTTLEIDDDLLEAARDLSRLKGQTIGQTVSELIRRGLTPEQAPAAAVAPVSAAFCASATRVAACVSGSALGAAPRPWMGKFRKTQKT